MSGRFVRDREVGRGGVDAELVHAGTRIGVLGEGNGGGGARQSTNEHSSSKSSRSAS